MRKLEFVAKAFDKYKEWIKDDRKTAFKIGDLVKEIISNPFAGLGKPGPLKHQLKGYWSRRIDNEHRLIYSVTDISLIIFVCIFHY